jgi:hypothetical protein
MRLRNVVLLVSAASLALAACSARPAKRVLAAGPGAPTARLLAIRGNNLEVLSQDGTPIGPADPIPDPKSLFSSYRPSGLVVSPDGAAAYVEETDTVDTVPSCRVSFVEAVSLASDSSQMIHPGGHVAISPNGTTMATTLKCAVSTLIAVGGADNPSSGSPVAPIPYAAGITVSALSFAPDGATLAITVSSPTRSQVYLYDTERAGASARLLGPTPTGSNSVPSAWSDGTYEGSTGQLGVIAGVAPGPASSAAPAVTRSRASIPPPVGAPQCWTCGPRDCPRRRSPSTPPAEGCRS